MLFAAVCLLLFALAVTLLRALWQGLRRRRGVAPDYLDLRGLLFLIVLAVFGWFLLMRFPWWVPEDGMSKRIIYPGFVYVEGLSRKSPAEAGWWKKSSQVKWVSIQSDEPLDVFLMLLSDSITARKTLQEGGKPQQVVAQLMNAREGTLYLPGYFLYGDNYALLFRTKKPAKALIRYGYGNKP